MVSVLASGPSGLRSGSGQGHCVMFLGKTFSLTYSASLHDHPGVFKWVPVNLTLEVTLCWTSIPSMGGK